MKYVWTVLVLLAGFTVIELGRPVCVPIAQEDLKGFSPPIEQRNDRDLFLFRTFQKRDGQWCQCKSWIARQRSSKQRGPQSPDPVAVKLDVACREMAQHHAPRIIDRSSHGKSAIGVTGVFLLALTAQTKSLIT